MKKELAREVTKGKIEVDFSYINKIIGGKIKGTNADNMKLFLF